MKYHVGQRVFADLRNGRGRVVGKIETAFALSPTTYPYTIINEVTGEQVFVLEREIVSDLPLSMESADIDAWLDA